ncbi:hypothetical protein [Methylobacterium sp. 77]|uniref:hypothetical protein n=1 Tax=Methylobacterium sp. 77 TaxID=1101192 RepID=UPI0003A35AFB|nr:hypothetical protein [Methylobacterium sp. 77]
MRHHILATAALLTLFGASAVQAQTTIIERDAPDRVIVDRPASESRTVETRESGDGCRTKSVTRENDEGDRKTVTRESCD